MSGKLELDIRDLMATLRSTPVIRGQGIWDPLGKTLIGDSYVLVDEGFAVCIQDMHVFMPYRSHIMRRDYVTFQYMQSPGPYYYYHAGRITQVRSGSVIMNAIPASVTEVRQPRPSGSGRGAAIHIARDLLIESFGLRPDFWRAERRDAFLSREAASLCIGMPLTPEMWMIIDALIDCTFDEPVRSLYLKAKAVELLSLTVVQFNRVDLPGGVPSLGSAVRDEQLIDIAALIYRRELSNPPSIDELGQRVGLNRNKLTNGFRAAFGATPAEYSRQVRLDWAARRIAEGLDVRRAAAEVGYNSVAAFGRAFQQRFGRAPAEQ